MCWIIKIVIFLLLPITGQDEKLQQVEKEVREFIGLANEHIYTDPAKAVSYSNNAILKAEQTGNAVLISNAWVSLGRSYVNLGSFDMGFEAYYNAYDNCPAENKQLQAYVAVSISSLYKSLGDVKKAFQFIDVATEIYVALNDTLGMANSLNTKGLIYEKIEAGEDAEKCFKQALELNRKAGRPKDIAKNLNNLCLLKGYPDEKIEMMREAIHINKLLGANWSLGENYNNLGVQYYHKKDYDKALECLEMAIVIANNLSAKELICDNYRYQTWVYEAMGNYKKAYENIKDLYELEKSMLSEKKIREMELNVADRRFRNQQKELNIKQKELKIKNLQRDILLIVLVTIAILTGGGYFMWRTRQLKKRQMIQAAQKIDEQQKEMIRLQLEKNEDERKTMQLELEHSKKELTNFACYVRSKNDLIEKIKSMIKESYKEAKPEVKAQLKTINAFITQYQNKEDNIGLLIDEIDRLNAEFVARLTELHPDLSKNEKQLASLLRIDFTTKEISLLVGATPKTVNMARYRLRKKLELETDEGLSEYMKKM